MKVYLGLMGEGENGGVVLCEDEGKVVSGRDELLSRRLVVELGRGTGLEGPVNSWAGD